MKRPVIAAALALAAAGAGAQQNDFYLGAALGRSSSSSCGHIRLGVSCKEGIANLKVFGGYQVNRNLALEAGYTNTLAKSNVESSGSFASSPFTSELKTKAWEITALPTMPLGESVSLHARAGAYLASTSVTTTTPIRQTFGLHGTVSTSGGTSSRDETNVSLTFGAGAAWHVSRRFSVRADWQRYNNAGGGNVEQFEVDNLNIGFLWRF